MYSYAHVLLHQCIAIHSSVIANRRYFNRDSIIAGDEVVCSHFLKRLIYFYLAMKRYMFDQSKKRKFIHQNSSQDNEQCQKMSEGKLTC